MKKYIVLVLTIMVFGSLYAQGDKEVEQKQLIDYNYKISIDNMTCTLCSVAVEKQLTKLDWIQEVYGDYNEGLALITVDNTLDTAAMEKIIARELDKIGYNFVKLKSLTNG